MIYQYKIQIAPHHEEKETEILFSLGATSISTSRLSSEKKEIIAIFNTNPELIPELNQAEGYTEILLESEWKYSWLDNYGPIQISDEIQILPYDTEQNNSDLKHNTYTYTILCDPSDAFGHGGHPTTSLCLKNLSQLIDSYPRNKRKELKILDAGTGTGLLAILASMKGCKHIDAFDIEEEAVKSATSNARLNNITNINIFQADIFSIEHKQELKKEYDIITANLLTEILLKTSLHFKKLLKNDGHLILSGISTEWIDSIKKTYEDNNFTIESIQTLENWSFFLLRINS